MDSIQTWYITRKELKLKTVLLVMAAGIGSRFGGGIKQLEPVDDNNHIILLWIILFMMRLKPISMK